MSWIESFDITDVALAVSFVLIIVSRAVSHSGLKLLDDESKVKLVDGSSRSSWFYLPLVAVILLLFWHFAVGVIALSVYVIFAMFYNSWWHYKNEMPMRYQTRVMASNGIALSALLVLAISFLIDLA